MSTASIKVSGDCKVAVDILDGEQQGFLLVHGLASNARLWDGVAEELNGRGHQVAIIDQRGHGRSDKPDSGYDFSTISQDLAIVVGYLKESAGFYNPVAVGQSWGGAVVESFAAAHPSLVKGVAVIDGGMTSLSEKFPEWSECKTLLAPPNLLGIPWEHFESLIRSTHPDWPETGIQGVLANMEKLPDGTFRPWLSREHHLEILWHLWQHDPYDTCAKLQVPILFVPAGGDPLRDLEKKAGLEKLSKLARKSKTVWFDPADHDIHAQYPKQLSDLLRTELVTGIFS
ncbi:MAG: alpha/beta hydrolase [Actinomycetota bacterium]|nr:MAG: alpha/beta hydrolase [Actinomycetota bacterium]